MKLIETGYGIFIVDGETPIDLMTGLENLRAFVVENSEKRINDLSHLWFEKTGVNKTARALAIVVDDSGVLIEKIDRARGHLQATPKMKIDSDLGKEGIYYSPAPLYPQKRLAFVYPGSGNHYEQMGREICLHWPEIIENQEKENEFLFGQIKPDLFWNYCSHQELNKNKRDLMIGQVAFGTLVSDLLRNFAVEPSAVLGYSLGESSALFGMRVWRERDLMLKRMNQSSLFTEDLAGEYRAAKKLWNFKKEQVVDWLISIINEKAENIKKVVGSKKHAYLLIVNTENESIIGGLKEEVEEVINELKCNSVPLKGVTLAHCEALKTVEKPYWELHHFKVTPPEGIDFYSAAWGDKYEVTSDKAADAILAQAVNTLDFPRLINKAYEDNIGIFVEIGPGNSFTRIIKENLKEKDYAAISASIPGRSEVENVLRVLAKLTAERVPVKFDKLFKRQSLKEKSEARKKPQISIKTGLTKIEIPSIERSRKIQEIPALIHEKKYEDTLETRAGLPISSSVRRTPIEQLEKMQISRIKAHKTYLKVSRNMADTILQNLQFQMSLVQQAGPEAINGNFTPQKIRQLSIDEEKGRIVTNISNIKTELGEMTPVKPCPVEKPVKNAALDRQMCMEFAVGSIAKVLGPGFAPVDNYPTRVRLPNEPLMLVDRILTIEGEPRSLTCGRVVTEHDIWPDSWYLDGNRIPTCIAVEAGQADLFLSGYLGIDFRTKGEAVYRLLDATITFHDSLPEPGNVIKYDIRIKHFCRQGNTYLFKFEFDSTVNGKPFLTMRDGCAGFFTERELKEGKGLVHTALDKMPQKGKVHANWKPLVEMREEAYSDKQIEDLRKGDLTACFGPDFKGLKLEKPYTLPGGKMELIHRVSAIIPDGGKYSLGLVRAEADIHPDDWFLTCHFSDDNVMPGTLMYECCLHTLRVFLMRMGWVSEEGQTHWEPVPGVAGKLKCRGQVIHTTRKASYEIFIKEIGYRPEPFVIADAIMYADGRPVVEMTDMSLQLAGASKEMMETLWAQKDEDLLRKSAVGKQKPVFDNDTIIAFAVGKPSEAFGDKYRVFDSERVIARLPGDPYKFLDRITRINNAEQWKMKAGGEILAQYEVPADEWYFRENRQDNMPFSVLLEVALQPCGWLAAYVGSALTSETDLSFRNLGGSAVQYAMVKPDTGILTTEVKLTGVSHSGGMIIQNYDFTVLNEGNYIYKGDTYFGFFTRDALKDQVGIRTPDIYRPARDEISKAQSLPYPSGSPFPGEQLRMIEEVELYIPDGGPYGLGFIRGSMKVNPEAWFFKAHFYQDPVIPGSLGLESMVQLMKFMAFKKWKWQNENTMVSMVPGARHDWLYRGQIIPADKKVTVDVWIKSIDNDHRVMFANGFLSVDGRIIYQMNDFSLKI
ncbi:MAG: hypothetical protein ACLFQV_01095 [Vulcanimicrobiota bacterium]